jgi:uncharacterized membrane protein HdeD (DUF308 family)
VRRPPPAEPAPEAETSDRAVYRAAARRLLRLALAAAAATAVVSLIFGLLAGSSVSRSLSVGFYLIGCAALLVGFALAVRGPVRLGGDEQHGFRVATRDEREDAIADSALLVALGVVLLLIGVLADTRYPLV